MTMNDKTSNDDRETSNDREASSDDRRGWGAPCGYCGTTYSAGEDICPRCGSEAGA